MENITKVQEKLTREEFELIRLEEEITSRIDFIKDNLEDYKKLGIITEEQGEFLTSLTIEEIRSSDIDKFKEIYSSISDIVKSIGGYIDDISQQIQQLNLMEGEGGTKD